MNGPRILLLVLVAAGLLLWMALSGPRDADLQRGVEQTDAAFAAVDAELAALDPDYQALRAQGLLLGLRESRDQVVTRLAELRSQRLDIVADKDLDRRQRLPKLRELAEQSDAMLALALSVHREASALVQFRQQAQPLVVDARQRRDALAQRTPPDDNARHRIEALASSLSEIEQRLQVTEQQIRRNFEQGVALGQGALRDLRALIDQQTALAAQLPP